MTRSAAAFLALLILPGIAHGQEQQRPATHAVVEGETLWQLAQRYYDNPYLWPRIYEANRGVVENPHWIYPGESLVIPGMTATVESVAVVTPDPAPAEQPPAQPPVVAPAAADERTVFWRQDQGDRFVAIERANAPVVSRDAFYSAPWLVAEGREPETLGRVGRIVGAEEHRRRTFFMYDRLQVVTDAALPTGTLLQTYRMVRAIDGVGTVAMPTGVLSVSEPAPTGVVALVVNEFDRIRPDDLVRPLPTYRVMAGVQPRDVPSGPAATIIGFSDEQAIQGLYDVAFLDRGGAAGVSVGDEYVVLWREEEGWPPTVEGRLQVVAVEPEHATARIVALRNPVFEPGLSVVLARQMP